MKGTVKEPDRQRKRTNIDIDRGTDRDNRLEEKRQKVSKIELETSSRS